MTIQRHHFNPTPAQRAALRSAANELREKLARKREQRRSAEEFASLGWSDTAAAELAEIHVEQRA